MKIRSGLFLNMDFVLITCGEKVKQTILLLECGQS